MTDAEVARLLVVTQSARRIADNGQNGRHGSSLMTDKAAVINEGLVHLQKQMHSITVC